MHSFVMRFQCASPVSSNEECINSAFIKESKSVKINMFLQKRNR